MVRALAVVAVAAWLAPPAAAFEFPSTSLTTAVSRGRHAFRGRIEALKQLTRGFNFTLARATVLVEQCYYGPCVAGKPVEIDYLAQSTKDEVDEDFGYATRLPLAAEVLFVFTRPQAATGVLQLNVRVHENSALAYVLSEMPRGWSEDELRPYSVYALRREQGEPAVTLQQLTELGEARRRELAQTVGKP